MAVVNLSEGRDAQRLTDLARIAGPSLLDVHRDGDHHRSVFTMGGPEVVDAVRALAARAVHLLDISTHAGVHPRLGVVDVVPWISLVGRPLRNGPEAPAVTARDDFARWAAETLGVPTFLYGPASGLLGPAVGEAGPGLYGVGGRSLPQVRSQAWRGLRPDLGPDQPHPSAGAMTVGARPVLVAYNLWLADADLDLARAIARSLRSDSLRCLGLAVGDAVQVSCNLIDPWRVGPGVVFDAVASRAAVDRAELVGLVPAAILAGEPPQRWAELDLDPARTIEARLERAGLDGGRLL